MRYGTTIASPMRSAVESAAVCGLGPMFKRLLQAGTCLAVLAPIGASASKATLSWNQVMRSWVGSWSCVTTSPKGTLTWSETATMFGTHWIRFVGTFYADKPFEALIEYDAKRRQWVTIYVGNGGDGDYGVSRSSAAPRSLVQNWVNAYPVDSGAPSDGAYTFAMTKNGYVNTAIVTANGKTAVIRDVCSKRP